MDSTLRKRGRKANPEKGLSIFKKLRDADPSRKDKCLFCNNPRLVNIKRKKGDICGSDECRKKRNAAYHVDYRQNIFQLPITKEKR